MWFRAHDIGINVIHNLPGVGANLQDHYVARVSHRVRHAKSINSLSRGTNLLKELATWAFSGKGALTFGVTSAMVFSRSRDGYQVLTFSYCLRRQVIQNAHWVSLSKKMA